MARIFIYHHPADAQVVRHLSESLAASGRHVATDLKHLDTSRPHCRIVVLSDNSVIDEDATFRDAVEAIAHESLLFVRIDSQVAPPFGFQDFTPVDLVTSTGATSLEHLAGRIDGILSRRPAIPLAAMPKQTVFERIKMGFAAIMERIGDELQTFFGHLWPLLRRFLFLLLIALLLFAAFKLFDRPSDRDPNLDIPAAPEVSLPACSEDAPLQDASTKCKRLSTELYELDRTLPLLTTRMAILKELATKQSDISDVNDQVDTRNRMAGAECRQHRCIRMRRPIERIHRAFAKNYAKDAYTQYRRATPEDPEAFAPYYELPLYLVELWRDDLRAAYIGLEIMEMRQDGAVTTTCSAYFGEDETPPPRADAFQTASNICTYAQQVDAEASAPNWRLIALRDGQSIRSVCTRMKNQLRDLDRWIDAINRQKLACRSGIGSECEGIQLGIDRLKTRILGLKVREAVLIGAAGTDTPEPLLSELRTQYDTLSQSRPGLLDRVTKACTVEAEGSCGPIQANLRPAPPIEEPAPEKPSTTPGNADENTERLCAGPPKSRAATRAEIQEPTDTQAKDNQKTEATPTETTQPAVSFDWLPWLVALLVLFFGLLILALLVTGRNERYVIVGEGSGGRRKPDPSRFGTMISYAWGDHASVHPIASQMQRMSIEIWIDWQDRFEGEKGAHMRAAAIKDSKVFTLMASQSAYHMQNTYRELHVAHYFDKPVVAIRLDDTAIPPHFAGHVVPTDPIIEEGTPGQQVRAALRKLYGGGAR